MPRVLHTQVSVLHHGEDAACTNSCLPMALNEFLTMQPARNLGCSYSLRMLYQLCLAFVSVNYNSVAHRHVSLGSVLARIFSVTLLCLDRYMRNVQGQSDSSKPL